jgi:hypothetical protein
MSRRGGQDGLVRVGQLDLLAAIARDVAPYPPKKSSSMPVWGSVKSRMRSNWLMACSDVKQQRTDFGIHSLKWLPHDLCKLW